MSEEIKKVRIDDCEFEVTEDDHYFHFTEISNRIGKAHFALSKDKKDHEKFRNGLKIFFTELFS